MSSSTENLAGMTVLVVEDDYFVASECVDLLREQGARVVGPVPDMGRARAMLAESRVDCVLLDINLKGEMVFQLARELASQGVPMVFTTGYDSSILPQDLRDRPCLQKPVDGRELVKLVRRQAEARAPAA